MIEVIKGDGSGIIKGRQTQDKNDLTPKEVAGLTLLLADRLGLSVERMMGSLDLLVQPINPEETPIYQ